jgi:hypothetical protein
MEDDETGLRPILKDESQEAVFAQLVRVGSDLDLLADVLRQYPDRHPEVWRSGEWVKDLKDLDLTCARLRRCAAQLDEIAERLRRGELRGSR